MFIKSVVDARTGNCPSAHVIYKSIDAPQRIHYLV